MNRPVRRATTVAAVALAGVVAAASPALAAMLGQAHSRVIVSGLTSGGAPAILYNGHAGLGGAQFNVLDVTVIPPI